MINYLNRCLLNDSLDYSAVGGAYRTQAGDEVIHSYEETLRVPMRLYEFGPSSVEKEKHGSSRTAGGSISPNKPINGTDVPTTAMVDSGSSRRFGIRTRFGDDFFEDCTRSPRSITQVLSSLFCVG